MLVMSKGGLGLGQAETYYEEKYSHDDYYSERQRVTGRWFGRAAEKLGLPREVRHEDFASLLRGIDPYGGHVLVNYAHGKSERRAGWDATFNAPKSLSVQALVGGDRRLIESHRRAVERALRELEEYGLARRHHGTEWVVTANIAAACFDHIAARPAATAADGFGPDPHLHTHVVVMNLTQRSDGVWRSLDPVEIYRSQSFATAVYRAELAREVQELGYRINLTGADGRWELEGYSREQVMVFSRRREDIEQQLADVGMSGAAAAQIAAHQTRGAKDVRDEETLRAEWRKRAAAYGIRADVVAGQAHRQGPLNVVDPQATAEEALHYATAHNTEREAVIDRRALEMVALQHSMGKIILNQVRHQIALDEENGPLIAIAKSYSSPQGAYTTCEMIALERDNIELMRAARGTAESIVEPVRVRAWAAARGMLPDQARVAEMTLGANDWLTAIEGRAGTTKTTTVAVIRELAEKQGYTVRGFGPTTGSVKALNEAGLPARTVASLIENPVPDPSRKEFWIIDESSLLPVRHVNRLLQQARSARVNRLLLVGDRLQHHAIEAGAPFKQLIDAGMMTARLDIIRRQRDPELRAAVALAATGEVGKAIAELGRQGRIVQIAGFEERYQAIAREYRAAHQAGQRTLVVSPANDERRALNTTIRDLLVAHGEISGGQEHTILVGRDLTRIQRRRAQSYVPGDIVRFRRGSQRLGLKKDSYARVERVDHDSNRIGVRTAEDRAVAYNPARLVAVDLFREERRKLGEGERIQFRAPHRDLHIANGEFATIVGLDPASGAARLRTDQGRELTLALHKLAHIDHGYVSTSHSAQGATVDRVIVNIDTSRSAQLVNRKQFYVSLSRARLDARIYTDDRAALARVATRNSEKSLALDSVISLESPHPQLRPEPRIITPLERIPQQQGQRQQQTRRAGIKL